MVEEIMLTALEMQPKTYPNNLGLVLMSFMSVAAAVLVAVLVVLRRKGVDLRLVSWRGVVPISETLEMLPRDVDAAA